MVYQPCCIDIYRGDEVSDSPTALAGLDRVKQSGVFALIHKATEGAQYRDARYDSRREKWMSGNAIAVTDVDGTKLSLSPLWGGYHFFHGDDPKAEAANFLMSSRFRPGDLAFIDWEAVGASGYQPSLEAADAFCNAVEAALGRPCGVYGGNVPRERFEAGRPSDAILERFAARPFWLCAYRTYSATLLPLAWKGKVPLLWQDDGDKNGPGPHVIPGMLGYCDNSTVVDPMTFAKLHEIWHGDSDTPAKPVPEAPVEVASAPNGVLQHIEDEIKAIETEIDKELKK